MSIKLTETQLVLLRAAAQRKDLCLVAAPTLMGATAQKVARVGADLRWLCKRGQGQGQGQ